MELVEKNGLRNRRVQNNRQNSIGRTKGTKPVLLYKRPRSLISQRSG
jgi:hypothetical protein